MSAQRATMTGTSLALLAVLFIALVILSNNLLRGVRFDLTENDLYTLSDGTRDILQDIDEPINLYFFFSDQASQGIPLLRTYAERVREMLEEFVLASDGKLKLHVIDPQPFSEAEDRATQFGLQAVPLGPGNDSVYFGLAGTNSTDGIDTIPFFQPDKEPFLEYDLAKLVYNLAHPKKPVLGLISSLPMNGGFDPMTRQPRQPWVIADQLGQLFEVRNLEPDNLTEIAPDVDVLMLVQPKDLSDQALYAIDQFILHGGRALIFVDPYAEADMGDPRNPQAAMMADKSSDLPRLFKAWGLQYDKSKVVGDRRYALQVQVSQGQPPVRHLGILSLTRDALAQDDVITGELSTINVAMSGFLSATDNAKVTLEPLFHSSDAAMPIDASEFRFLSDPATLQKDFQPTGERYVMAARLSGEVPSAFPDGPPAPEDKGESTTETAAPDKADFLARSDGPINVIVVADTDLLTDRLWVRTSSFFGQQISSAWANNGDFVTNGVDNLLGNSDLLSLRGRATSNRPFLRVQALQQAADARFRAKEQELQSELRQTENRLNELQSQRGQQSQSSSNGELILTPEQQAEVDKLRQRLLEVRQELRQVRRDLDRDIERLGDWLKFINIALMPILVAVIGLITALVLRSRRRARRY